MDNPLTVPQQYIVLTVIFICLMLILAGIAGSPEFEDNTRIMSVVCAIGSFSAAMLSFIMALISHHSPVSGHDSPEKRSSTGNTEIIDGQVYYKTDKSNLKARNKQAEKLNEAKNRRNPGEIDMDNSDLPQEW